MLRLNDSRNSLQDEGAALVHRNAHRRAPRSVATPRGASNLDAIIDEGTLTLGWVGPALLGILIAAFGWAGRVFEWLGRGKD